MLNNTKNVLTQSFVAMEPILKRHDKVCFTTPVNVALDIKFEQECIPVGCVPAAC